MAECYITHSEPTFIPTGLGFCSPTIRIEAEDRATRAVGSRWRESATSTEWVSVTHSSPEERKTLRFSLEYWRAEGDVPRPRFVNMVLRELEVLPPLA